MWPKTNALAAFLNLSPGPLINWRLWPLMGWRNVHRVKIWGVKPRPSHAETRSVFCSSENSPGLAVHVFTKARHRLVGATIRPFVSSAGFELPFGVSNVNRCPFHTAPFLVIQRCVKPLCLSENPKDAGNKSDARNSPFGVRFWHGHSRPIR